MWSEKILTIKVLAVVNIICLSLGMAYGFVVYNLPALFFSFSGICGWVLVMIINEKIEECLES